MSVDKDKKAKLKAWKEQHDRELLKSIPVSKEDLLGLFDYLDSESSSPCDHTLRNTLEYLKEKNLDAENVVPWLREHGGFCDCEVFNVEDELRGILEN
jgi:hypothetical protein